MKQDKKLSILNMAVQNLKAKKFRTAFMSFFVVLMSATVFFSTILMNNMELGIKNTTERMGADLIVVPKEGTMGLRDAFFAGTPCTILFDAEWEDAVRGVEGVERVSAQMYVATLAASCCDIPVQIIAFDPDTDFVIKPWLEGQTEFNVKTGQVVVGSNVTAQVGESIKLYDTLFEVAGRLEETGMGYDGSVFMTFDTLYALKDSTTAGEVLPIDEMENMVSMLFLDVADGIEGAQMATLRTAIERLNVTSEKMYACTADDLMSGIAEDVQKLSGYGSILIWISLISTALALISIFVLTINERKYEFGVLYALGAQKSQMTKLILSEALIISGAGGVLGVAIAYFLIATFKNMISSGLDIPYLDISVAQCAPVAALCIVITLMTGVVAAVCSAYGISKGEVYRLLRENE